MWQHDVAIFVCPVCRAPLTLLADEGGSGVLGHDGGGCLERYPVIGGIPRLLQGAARHDVAQAHQEWFRRHPDVRGWSTAVRPDSAALRLVRRFDHEWQRYADMAATERAAVFAEYFDLISDTEMTSGRTVLDAGCGGGRWAAEVSARGAHVVALDLGRSVELAARRVGQGATFIHADIRDVPLAPAAVDLAYSLGVLHHVDETGLAVARIVQAIRPGGRFLIYLYYALDGRGPAFRALFGVADAARQVISSLPQSIAEAVSTVIAGVVYLPLARLARLLDLIGLRRVADRLPLRFYSTLSFRTMRNDSLDRFGTKLEKRYSRAEVIALLEAAGLVDVTVSEHAPYWHAVARRPSDDANTSATQPVEGNVKVSR